MKHRLFAMLLVLVVATPGHASMVVVLVSLDRVVAATDSRVMLRNPATGAEAGHVDDGLKFEARGKFLLLATGATFFPSRPANKGLFLDPWAEWASLVFSPRDSARAVMDRVLAGLLRQRVTPTPGQAITICQTGVIRFAGPVPDGRIVRIETVAGQAGKVLSDIAPTTMPYTFIASDDVPLREQLNKDLPFRLWLRPTEAAMVQLAEDAIAAGARRSPTVGGPTHVVVIDASGSRRLK